MLNKENHYIDSPDWIKNKKVTINPVNKKDNKCFQYAVTVMLNHEEIKKDPNKYNWEGIHYPSEKDDWKKFEENNLKVAFNVLYAKREKLYPAYVSKQLKLSKIKFFF